MNRTPHINSKAQDIQEMAEALRIIGALVNEDLVRRCSADVRTGAPLQPFLGDPELGGLMSAVEHLSITIEGLAESIDQEESRLAERDDREGRRS